MSPPVGSTQTTHPSLLPEPNACPAQPPPGDRCIGTREQPVMCPAGGLTPEQDAALNAQWWNGLSPQEMRQYLMYVADQRLTALGMVPEFGAKNPFPFLDLQDVQELTNFFERRVSAYQVGINGAVAFDDVF